MSIVALVTAIVIALSALHLSGIIGESFDDVGERGRIVAEQVGAYLLDAINRRAPAPSLPPDQMKAAWYEVVRRDTGLQRFLQRTLVLNNSVVDITVVDNNNRILSAADPRRIGAQQPPARSWNEWQSHGLYWRLQDLYRSSGDMLVEMPLGFRESSTPILNVTVAISPVLLRRDVEPKLRELAAAGGMSLALSILLAIVVSKLVGDSLARLGQKIDLIAQGDLQSVQKDRFDSPEMANLETKLWWLGRQYSGARADATHLRGNIEQMLRKLEQAILVFGPDHRLQMAGESAERLLARPRDQILGRSIADLFPTWTSVGGTIDRAIATHTSIRDHAVNLERPNMPTVRVLLSVEPIEYEGFSATGLLITLRDAETRQQVQAGLDTAQRLSAISRITSGVAHEIKNPLNAMMLHLEVAQEKLRNGNDGSAELDVVKRELLRLDRVVKALLDFNRPVDVRMTECDLRPLTDDIVLLITPQAAAKNIQVAVNHSIEAAPVMADADLLKQGILNVAVNGLEAVPSGGEIRVMLRRDDDQYVVAIEDTGPGIPAEIRDKIFNLYFTTKQTGTGVGLAMTFRIMQLHGGTIQVESEVGKGACFRLALPARQPRKAAA